MTAVLLSMYRLALLLTVFMMGYLATMSSALPAVVDVSDKFLHGLAFFVLLFLVDFSWPKVGLIAVKLLSVFAYGVLIEGVQYFLSYREASWVDLMANVLGMGLYAVISPWLYRLPFLCRRWYC